MKVDGLKNETLNLTSYKDGGYNARERDSIQRGEKTAQRDEENVGYQMISRRSYVSAALLAQLLSLTIAGTGVVNDQLFERFHINIPTFQSVFNYILLTLIFVPIWIKSFIKEKHDFRDLIQNRIWKYMLLSLADVEANFFMVKAYSMTIITTIQVIDAFILPITVFLSFLLLKHSFRVLHILGVMGALLGCALIILADYLVKNSDGQHKLLGDMFCLIASIFYALSNVGAEYFIKENSKREYLSMMGVFGTVISCLQIIYTLLPCVIEMSSAAFLNVNLLAADFYSVLFGIFIKKYQLHVFYFLGFGCIIVGTVLYSVTRPKATVSSQPRPLIATNQQPNSTEMTLKILS